MVMVAVVVVRAGPAPHGVGLASVVAPREIALSAAHRPHRVGGVVVALGPHRVDHGRGRGDAAPRRVGGDRGAVAAPRGVAAFVLAAGDGARGVAAGIGSGDALGVLRRARGSG